MFASERERARTKFTCTPLAVISGRVRTQLPFFLAKRTYLNRKLGRRSFNLRLLLQLKTHLAQVHRSSRLALWVVRDLVVAQDALCRQGEKAHLPWFHEELASSIATLLEEALLKQLGILVEHCLSDVPRTS